MNAQPLLADKNWQAHLSLRFTGRDDRTFISHRAHHGPLVIQKPFYPEGRVCHVYLLHPPGGVVGGDQLTLDVDVNNAGHALVTTPAAGKCYRSNGRRAHLQQHLHVDAGSALEWLPQETILFSASRVAMKTLVHLQSGASFIGWEILCLGRPACNEYFDEGDVRQAFEIWRDGKPLILERARLAGGADVLGAAWGLQHYTVSATLLAVNANRDVLQTVRDHAPTLDGLFSASLIDDVLVCRVLAHQAEAARLAFIQAWQHVRPALLNRQACEPRIWST